MGATTSHKLKLGFDQHYFDDRFKIISTICRGRSSVVYKAVKLTSDNQSDLNSAPVVIKVVPSSEKNQGTNIKRVEKESLALLSCLHPNVIRLHDYAARQDLCYMTLEYAEYGSLRELFSSDKNFLSPRATFKLIQEVLRGVSAIHQAGIIHRDIKPENILLAENYQVKICDFSACLLNGEKSSIQLVSKIVGTFDYIAPECLRGEEYSVSSDLYAVSVTCYELLHGLRPFISKSLNEGLHKKVNLDLQISRNLILEFPCIEVFFRKALAPNEKDRFKSAEDMINAIDLVLKDSFFEESIEDEDGVLDSREKIKFYLQQIKKLKINSFKLFRYFLYSFFVTLCLFYLSNFVYSSLKQINLKVSSYLSLKIKEENLRYALTSKPAMGDIKNLYTINTLYRYVITPINKDKALFSLLVSGWQPVEVSLDQLEKNGTLHIEGRGLDIVVKFNQLSKKDSWSGDFENLLTGKRGEMSLFIVNQ